MINNDVFVIFINSSLFLFGHVNNFISIGGMINTLSNANNPK
ncbi:hypothetical protein JPSP8_18750 [Staphylococcus pseudintermedius]